MAEGSNEYKGLADPLRGNSNIQGINDTYDVLTITGYTTDQTGDFLVAQTAAGVEKFVVDASGNVTAAGTLAVTGASTLTGNVSLSGKVAKMVLGTIALASLASNASATVALSGMTTAMVVNIFCRGATTAPLPMVWASDTDKLGYGAPSVATAATTVNYWMFATA